MKYSNATGLWIMAVLGTVFFVIFPLCAYLSSRKLKQSIVSFTTHFWSFDLLLLLFLLSMQLAILGLVARPGVAFRLFSSPKQIAVGLGLGIGLLLGCGLLCAYLWLYWSYWQHDRTKSLTFYKDENLLRYWQGDEYTEYAVSDVVTRTRHDSKTAKLSFSYTILTFSNGAEILVTNLLCGASDLAQLLPNANSVFLQASFPWLPKAAVS
jgi:hypothetical protein